MSLRPNSRTDSHQKSYKARVDGGQSRRRREDDLVEIRKSKRDHNLAKKRTEGGGALAPPPPPPPLQLESLLAMVEGVNSPDPMLQLESTSQFREFISIEPSPPIEEVIKTGVVPKLVEFLRRDEFPQLQSEATWVLTNIASGSSEQTQIVIDAGAVPMFVKLLVSSSYEVREQAVWALGNVAGDSAACRDLVLGCGALMPLLAQLNEYSELSMLRNGTWTLSNLCHGKPPVPLKNVKPAISVLQRLIYSSDEEVLAYACQALSNLSYDYISDDTMDKIRAVVEAGVCPRLVKLLLHPNAEVLIPALRTIGCIATSDDLETQCLVDNQVLPFLHQLLTQENEKRIKMDAISIISNIASANRGQLQAVIDANLIPTLVQLLQHTEFEIKMKAAWAIYSCTSVGSHEQIQYLVSQNCIKPLCDLLICLDSWVVSICLDGLENILAVGKAVKDLGRSGGVNTYAQIIGECEGLDKIERLQTHDNNEICKKAVWILERYWVDDEEEEQAVAEEAQHLDLASQPNVPSGGFVFLI
ncbi:hypothetical protein Sjap_007248 [Stephania japonica]|uniref:Importin subunit alpha n=1 Tax=Stephania japonica TaxID=461633 RepID=A0AAP0JMU0_9MAGN